MGLRAILLLLLMSGLAACGGGQKGPLPQSQMQAVAWRDSGPPQLTIFTMINNRTGKGGHTALMVSGSQRVIFDPAGSFRHSAVTEYGDVLYGMSDAYVQGYKSAHARNSHHVVSQTFTVSPEVAERALHLVQAQGTVPGAFCTNSTVGILRQLSGFQTVKSTFYPHQLMADLATKPGVSTDKYYENDDGDVLDGLEGLTLGE